MNRESHEEYMKRRMREEDERQGIKQIESNFQLQRRIEKLEDQVNSILEKLN